MLGNVPDLKEADLHVQMTEGVIVLDSKGVYDECKQLVITPKGKERRIDAELANSLTKPHEPWQLALFYSSGQRWRLVYDEKFMSARKRKTAGLQPLQAEDPTVDDDGEEA